MSEEWSVCEQRAAPVEWHFDEKKREKEPSVAVSQQRRWFYTVRSTESQTEHNATQSSLLSSVSALIWTGKEYRKKKKKNQNHFCSYQRDVCFSPVEVKGNLKWDVFQKSGNNIHRNIREISIQFTNLSIGRLIEESLFFLFWSNW